jgi:AraC-like DNA-binding protein
MGELAAKDIDLLDKVYVDIKNNVGNENYSVEYLAQSAGLSRSMLHRKLLALTGKCISGN